MRNKRTLNPLGILKDYAVPFAWILVILLVIYFGFFSWKSAPGVNHENQVWIWIQLGTPTDDVSIVYPGDFKKKVEGQVSLYKWEKVLVNEGTALLKADTIWTFNVNKIGEFKYNEDATFSLYSSDVWVDSKAPISVSMRYALVNIWQNSHVNLTQNEVGSTVYLLDGTAEVKNLGWKSTVLSKWQKIMISSIDTTKTDVDLSLEKTTIDDTFKTSDWYIKNNGDLYSNQTNTLTATWSNWFFSETWTTAATWFTSAWTSQWPWIKIENLADEQTFTESPVTINGSYDSDEVANIKLNATNAIIDKTTKRFSVKDFPLVWGENDLIFKVYNASNEILWKYPYTVYMKGTTQNKSAFDVKNFSLDTTNFKFTSPTENPYTTSDDVVTIEWMVPARTVAYIEVNGFRLWKFPKNGSYWKYFANAKSWNLQNGLNVYDVKYFWQDDKVLHENAFTIIKNGSGSTVQTGAKQ